MIHLDLFSGIGGFAYAADQVWDDMEHIFCDIEPFARQVLKKHWPEAYIYDDIRSITADSYISRYLLRESQKLPAERPHQAQREPEPGVRASGIHLLTGGFPCQPFSAAGLRRGTADERHLWPEMLRVIRLTKPTWVIAENVRGLLNWNEGVVFEQVCTDLEAEGYAVWPFIIPAVAVGAPHRRDRVWFVAYKSGERLQGPTGASTKGTGPTRDDRDDTNSQGPKPYGDWSEPARAQDRFANEDWGQNWLEVATRLCRVDDGISAELDGRMTPAKHRAERLKALGNAIVPQVAMEIMRGISDAG